MASSRIGRINEEIMRQLSTDIRSLKDPRVQGMITITAVDTASDLRTAKVYVSVYDKSRSKEVLKGLNSPGGSPAAAGGKFAAALYTGTGV